MPNEAPVRVRTKLKIFSGLPNLVPSFCVFFILLVFFMLSSNFVPIRGIAVNLPRASGNLTYASRNLVVTVDRDNKLYFNDATVTNSDELKRQLSEALNARGVQPDKERIIIRCDVRAPLSTVADVLSVAEELNVNALFMSAGQPRGKTTSFTEPER